MGWGDCGTDSEGRNIGYVWEAICDHEGCETEIDRGLGYACGGMHGEDEHSCEKYFCGEHLRYAELPDGECVQLCHECYKLLEEQQREE